MSDTPTNPNVSSVRDDRRQKTGLGWLTWLGWIIAALVIAAAIYLIVRGTGVQHQLNTSNEQLTQLKAQDARYQKLMDALTSPDSERILLTENRLPPRPAGQVVYQSKSGSLVFIASHLRSVPQSKSYELWLIPADGQAPISAGLFRPDADGSTSIVLPSLPPGVEAREFFVTLEEAQGAPTPTLPILMSGRK